LPQARLVDWDELTRQVINPNDLAIPEMRPESELLEKL